MMLEMGLHNQLTAPASNGSPHYHGEANSGAVVRPQHRSLHQHHHHQQPVPAYMMHDDPNYKDNIRYLNCNRFWRRLGVPLSQRSCIRLWCVKDWTGWCAAIFTWVLIFGGELVFFIFVIYPFPYPIYGAINGFFNLACSLLGFASHLRAMFSDPVSHSTIQHITGSILGHSPNHEVENCTFPGILSSGGGGERTLVNVHVVLFIHLQNSEM